MTVLRDTDQAAEFLRLKPQTLANWRVMGKGPAFHKCGSRVVYSEKDLNAWLEDRRLTNSQQ